MILADIERMLADYQPLTDPFNGATRLVMAPDVFKALAPHIEQYAAHPLIRPRIEIDVQPTFPEKHAMGFRQWRDGDDPEIQDIGEVLVWLLAPQTKTTTKEQPVGC